MNKVIAHNQLFLYNNRNVLIYKRWFARDKGKMFYEGEGAGEKEHIKINNK